MGGSRAPEWQRRREILAAAADVAAEAGVAGLTLRAVAARAGLSHGLVLYHFGSRERLVDALFEDVLGWLAARGSDGPPGEDVWSLIDDEVRSVDDARSSVLLDFWTGSARHAARAGRIAAALDAYEAALAAGLAVEDDRLRSELAAFVARTVYGTVLRRLLGAAPDSGLSAGARRRLADPTTSGDAS